MALSFFPANSPRGWTGFVKPDNTETVQSEPPGSSSLRDPGPARRELGFWSATALVVGHTIGVGIFLTPAELMLTSFVNMGHAAVDSTIVVLEINRVHGTDAIASLALEHDLSDLRRKQWVGTHGGRRQPLGWRPAWTARIARHKRQNERADKGESADHDIARILSQGAFIQEIQAIRDPSCLMCPGIQKWSCQPPQPSKPASWYS
jgi:hypothetical protein